MIQDEATYYACFLEEEDMNDDSTCYASTPSVDVYVGCKSCTRDIVFEIFHDLRIYVATCLL